MPYLTKRDFDRLRVGDFLTDKEGKLYKIDMDYVFGPPAQVFSAVLQNGDKYQAIRIDGSNFHLYKRAFPC